MNVPPPHVIWHEPLNDVQMGVVWNEYKGKVDSYEIDAAEVYSAEEFSARLEAWITRKSSARIHVLLIWHAHFLSSACQQILRRWMETKSWKCRVWFHVEYLNTIQQAILSRCVLKNIQDIVHPIPDIQIL